MLAMVVESTKNEQTESISLARKIYRNKQVSATLISKLEVLIKELFETFLTPEKYPEREVVIEIKGRLMDNIYNGFVDILFINKWDTKKGVEMNNIIAANTPKKRL